MNAISHALESIRIGTPVSTGGLTMYPLLSKSPRHPAYLLLDEGLESGLAEVTEVSESGSVPELFFRNKGEKDILLADGEELVGAKQNRVLNLSILVAGGQELKIPVSCVEAGRWSWRSKRFASGQRKLHAAARSEKMRRVSESLARSGAHADHDVQRAVWDSIDRKISGSRLHSETRSLHDVYGARETLLAAVRDGFGATPDQVGAAFAIGGRLVGFDLYDSPATLRKLLPKLVDSYALDAIDEEQALSQVRPGAGQVQALLQRIANAQAQEYPAIGKGSDIRIDAAPTHAAALVADGRVTHVAAFEASA